MSTLCTCRHLLSWHGDDGCTWEGCRCPFVRSFAAAPPPYSATGGNGDAPSDQHASICVRTGFHLCVECRSAVPLPVLEDGAVSAIADHSTGSGPDALEGRRRGSLSTPKGATEAPAISAADAGGGTYSTEPRRTLHGPEVEAAGDAHPSYRQGLQTHEHRLVRALAAARLDMRSDPDGIYAFMAAAEAVAALVPILHCAGCDRDFLQMDGRNTMWCSERCRSRVGQRARRARLKAEATGKPARCDPSRGIHVRPHTPETGCGVPRRPR